MLFHCLHACQLDLVSTPSLRPRAAPAAALARLSARVRLLSTFHLAGCVPFCTTLCPLFLSHVSESTHPSAPPSFTFAKTPCHFPQGDFHFRVIDNYFEMGWISGLPLVTYGTRFPAEEAYKTLEN